MIDYSFNQTTGEVNEIRKFKGRNSKFIKPDELITNKLYYTVVSDIFNGGFYQSTILLEMMFLHVPDNLQRNIADIIDRISDGDDAIFEDSIKDKFEIFDFDTSKYEYQVIIDVINNTRIALPDNFSMEVISDPFKSNNISKSMLIDNRKTSDHFIKREVFNIDALVRSRQCDIRHKSYYGG